MLNNGAPVQFTVSGNVPNFVMELFRNAFPIVKEEDDGGLVEISQSDWYREMQETVTPGDSLRSLRSMRGMRQKELADAIGVKPQQVSDMEKGRSPIGRKMAMRIGKALNMNYKHFL